MIFGPFMDGSLLFAGGNKVIYHVSDEEAISQVFFLREVGQVFQDALSLSKCSI
jgi:hypothetical protein